MENKSIGLWKKVSKNNENVYFSGRNDKQRFVVYKNDKRNDKSPDFNLYIHDIEEQQEPKVVFQSHEDSVF